MDRGIYCVAYGDEARGCARELIRTVHKYAEVPVCVVSDSPMLDADVSIVREARDPGARWYKTRIWELAPEHWERVLYLDADIMVRGRLDPIFRWLDDGWDLVMTMSPQEAITMRQGQRRDYLRENFYSNNVLAGDDWLQMSGGVWAFRRTKAAEIFLKDLHKEWCRFHHRDQQAMNRAWYANPPKTWLLPSEWNWFVHHGHPPDRAVILHFATAARAWVVRHPGKSLWVKWREKL